ncbi:uncharacterized protein LOC103828611 [Brassica rapa]|uniref:DUF3741 domain-containing protein n=2 Tax=Brassica TaxID=3705 RepID=A0ABQ8CKQ3_BRANA|nr:uncharacterized protein LOC103828611 [Brassica rapa]XP_013662964.1 uncharacterized protein LOC106367681 [Brassica napus]KAH0917649.1 hypothetical protein HID58_025309 [Brassica napus]CAG7901248.1 unnamed protein product [Brassica rapa]VDC96497.1 unnamed protein product [Brassica rapa]
MPEGKLRSGVYRSFIMCDDPRGVVERGAIKKQRYNSICSGTNQRFDHPSKPKERSETAPRKSTEDAPAPSSSLQLLRVSKGIQKLNVAIDSYSKGSSYETVRPEDIAKGLLRGALDLEESLAMLSSIQEADNKQKGRVSKDGSRDLRFQRSMSDRFGERIEKRMMVQENAASRDCYDELRNVIRESFHRQNLLPQTSNTETKKTRVARSGFASSSTSSSQSSMVSGSTKSSASSDVPRRPPSLIARLMGLDVSPQVQNISTVKHIDKPVIVNVSPERQEKLLKRKKKESPETVRCNSTRKPVLHSLPEEIPSENPSSIVLIKPVNVVQDEKPGNKRPVLPKKPRMQGEVHPRMIINQRKDHQAKGGSKTSSSNTMKLPSSPTKKDKMVRKVEENEGKVMKLLSPSNVTRQGKPKENIKKIYVKKEDISEGKDRRSALKPPANHSTHKKSNGSSEMSRNKNQRSRLSSSSSSSSDEQKSNSRLKKPGEASKRSPKKKLHQRDNYDLASENNSSSSQDTRVSINQLSAEETTSSELHIQGHCDSGEVTSCAPTIQQETSLRSFLSNSSDFISYAENLFDFKTNTNRSQERTCQDRDSSVISDQRLALDFAKEVARRRSLLLITEPTCLLRSSLHIDELLMEVCDGFDSLRSYRDTFLNQSSFVKESIHMALEKDLYSKKKEMTSGVWDLGWRSEFQIDETHQAVVDLEKLILSGLIQEIFS